MTNFLGKYRGKVKKNQDPKNLGRLQVIVPEVLDVDNENWALPCLPYTGKDMGMFTIPPEGANIWVEFEGGNRDRPIWTGCFWINEEVPKEVLAAYEQNGDPAEIQVFKTEDLILILSRRTKKEGVTLEIKLPKKDNKNAKKVIKLTLDKKGIEIKHDQQTLLKLTEDLLELKTKETGVDITAKQIQLKEKEGGEGKLEESGIELNKKSSTAKLTNDGIQLKNGKSEMQLASSGIKISNDGSEIAINSAIDVKNSGGAKINLSQVKVNVNNGALEVM
ncbi:hypothetical protein BJP34_16750 [Moorena producens PAL-8-15-08-1]|uniref:Gp5/Type VI secretion system Vgr protein OB-fold domain-containing protein n=1 Tax=Moorena producens PAL-8-15-08-1 TaxID=1458985 RepID=A0A1D8TTF1_9CYAN|nr:phage baseplate assembly protein V [Moorena producens]AOX00874.1 hypothetical protein BJP34_16750 [Moorena producens PAL-8-15-08-1]